MNYNKQSFYTETPTKEIMQCNKSEMPRNMIGTLNFKCDVTNALEQPYVVTLQYTPALIVCITNSSNGPDYSQEWKKSTDKREMFSNVRSERSEQIVNNKIESRLETSFSTMVHSILCSWISTS